MKFDHLNGWLVLYLIGSLPVLAFHSAGLAGWFFDYPMPLFLGILITLTIPLWLLLFNVAQAPAWNIAGLWTGALLLVARVAWGWFYADADRLTSDAVLTLAGSGVGAIAWATLWTAFFMRSEHVARTFGAP